MPQNKRLDGVLATEETSVAIAQWLIDLVDRLHEAAPDGCQERTYRATIGVQVKAHLDSYREHRGKNDQLRSASHKNLCDRLRSYVSQLRSLLVLDPYVVHDKADYETAITAIIEGSKWTFICSCGRRTSQAAIDGSYYCDRCSEVFTAKCAKCDSLHGKHWFTPIINVLGQEMYFCPEHVPAGTSICGHCDARFDGPPNAGSVKAKAMSAAGICTCRNCSQGYQLKSCGHWTHGRGHRLAVVVDMEDDNRIRERVMENESYVCSDCYREEDDGPELWRLEKSAMNGHVFADIQSHRTYGVELEFCKVSNMPGLAHELKQWWTAKGDDSLPHGGVEMASTILRGDEGLDVIRHLCDYATEHQWAVDARSGFHLHIGLPEGHKSVAAVAMGYMLTYELWRHFVAPSRSNNCKYCRPLRLSPIDALTLPPEKYIYHLTSNGDRRVWCNWMAYNKFSTVELRIHQGTKVYEKVANWAKAHTRFCDWCVGIGDPKKVHDRLAKHQFQPRELFLIVAQEAWKDRPLGRWFRERAAVLHKADNRLLSSRQMRSQGIDPKNKTATIQGIKPFVLGVGQLWYIANMNEHRGSTKYIQASGRWDSGDAQAFRTEALAKQWIEAHCDGATVKRPATKPIHSSEGAIGRWTSIEV